MLVSRRTRRTPSARLFVELSPRLASGVCVTSAPHGPAASNLSGSVIGVRGEMLLSPD
jgi:hypothetical protein